MKKIIIRRKEVLNHLPKEIRAGAKINIGSIYVGRQPLKGVEGEEAHKLMSKILSVPPNHESWPKEERDFWASMTVKIPFEGKELDITVDEDGFPFNVLDYVTYKWLLKHRQVAKSLDEMNQNEQKKFYIYDPELDLLKKNSEIKVRKEAGKEFIKLSSDYTTMRRLLRVLAKGSRPDSLQDMQVENQLYDIKNSSPERFLKYALDKNLDTRAELEEMIEYNVITAIGNQLMYGDEIIGENINEAIVYMNNKKNSGQVTAMKAQLKELKV